MLENEQARNISAVKITVYIAVSFVLAVFQTTIGAKAAFFGAVPQITLALTGAAAYFYGSLTGAVAGIASGVFTEALGATGITLLPLFYMLVGWFIGSYSTEKRGQRRAGFGGYCIALFATAIVGIAITVVRLVLNAGKPNIFLAILHIALPEALNTYIYGILIGVVHWTIEKIRESRAKNKE